MAEQEKKQSQKSKACDDNADEVKRAMLLNALAGPGGINTGLANADIPIAGGAEELNDEKRTE